MPPLKLKILIVIICAAVSVSLANFLLEKFLEEKFSWFEKLQAERNFEYEISKRDELKAALKDKSGLERIIFFKRWKEFK